jgi:hypothetical protein
MSRARNTTTAPTGSIAPLGLRLLPDLRDKIDIAARENGRSINAEVTARLQGSFDFLADLKPVVREAVSDVMAKQGCSPADALEALVLAGQANGGTVLCIRITPGMTLKEVRDAINTMAEVVPNATLGAIDLG